MGTDNSKNRKVKSKNLCDVWDAARSFSIMGATTEITIDFEKVTDRVRSKVSKALQNYPEGHAGGYRSHARKLYDKVSEFYELPRNYIDQSCVRLVHLHDKAVYDEVYAVLYADAVAQRMETGREWPIQRLEKNSSRENGNIYYYHLEEQTYQHMQESGLIERIKASVKETLADRLDKALTTVQFGGKITFVVER